MSRNFGAGSRDMADAARIFLGRDRVAGGLSFESVAAHGERFELFARFVKESGIGRLERIDPDLVQRYGRGLAIQVEAGKLSAATAQNRVSSVNKVLSIATAGQWRSIGAVADCGIARRSNIRTVAPTSLAGGLDAAVKATSPRGQVLCPLLIELGVRPKEASLLDCKKAYDQAVDHGCVTVTFGTKGGQARTLDITDARQIEALRAAAEQQGDAKNLIPAGMTWKQFQAGELREIREALQSHGITDLKDLRAGYACTRYEQLTGGPAPVLGGEIRDRNLDLQARLTIGIELGHERVDVVAAYIGGRK